MSIGKRLLHYSTFAAFLFAACNKPFIKKRVHDRNIEVTWFTESYISSTRDFVSAKDGLTHTIVLNCNSSQITDIDIIKNTIVIKFFRPKDGIVYFRAPRFESYYVRIDSVLYYDWNKYYHPEFYKK